MHACNRDQVAWLKLIAAFFEYAQMYLGVNLADRPTWVKSFDRYGIRDEPHVSCWWGSGFSQTHNIGNNTNISIGGFSIWKQKKIQWKMLPPVGIELRPLITFDSKSSTLLSTLTCHVLLRRSLNFCSCTTWFLDLEDSVRINRA